MCDGCRKGKDMMPMMPVMPMMQMMPIPPMPVNPRYAFPYVLYQSNCGTFPFPKGFEKGTIYPELYQPYFYSDLKGESA